MSLFNFYCHFKSYISCRYKVLFDFNSPEVRVGLSPSFFNSLITYGMAWFVEQVSLLKGRSSRSTRIESHQSVIRGDTKEM